MELADVLALLIIRASRCIGQVCGHVVVIRFWISCRGVGNWDMTSVARMLMKRRTCPRHRQWTSFSRTGTGLHLEPRLAVHVRQSIVVIVLVVVNVLFHVQRLHFCRLLVGSKRGVAPLLVRRHCVTELG